MAKISIVGEAVVITSALKLEDIKTVAKYRPAALTLMGGEDGKEPIFKLGVGDHGTINQYGAEFAAATHDDEKLATMTLIMQVSDDATADDIKELVADGIGGYVATLNKLEAAIPAVLEEIKVEREAIMASISVQ